jgi:hypothetical protein
MKMSKSIVAAVVIFAILLTGSLAPCVAAPLVSQTGGNETCAESHEQSPTASATIAIDEQMMDDAVVGQAVEGVTNTQLVVIGLGVVFIVVAIIAVT